MSTSFRYAPWSCQTEGWPSPFAVPRFVDGRLGTCGQHAHNLLHHFFTNRLHVTVRPGPEMLLNATMVGDSASQGDLLGLASANATYRSRFVTLTGGLCTGDPGRVKAAVVVQPVRGVLAYTALQLVLDQVQPSQHGVTAGVGVDREAFTGYVQTVLRGPEDLGKRFEARAIVRSGALQFAAEAAIRMLDNNNSSNSSSNNVGDHDGGSGLYQQARQPAELLFTTASPARPGFSNGASLSGSSGGSGGMDDADFGADKNGFGNSNGGHGFGFEPSNDGSSAIVAGNVALTGVKLRVVYSNTTHTALGQPHSYQLGLSVEDGGRTIIGSYYHHLASRVCTEHLCFWRNLAFGGEYTFRPQPDGNRPMGELLLGSMVQLTVNTLAKFRLSSRGALDAMGVFRVWNLHELIPSVLGSFAVGYNIYTGRPRFGFTLALGEGEVGDDHPMGSS